jgi:hypothetical protein
MLKEGGQVYQPLTDVEIKKVRMIGISMDKNLIFCFMMGNLQWSCLIIKVFS